MRTDTYGWQAQLEDRLRRERYDAVVEAALGRPEEFLAEVAEYRRFLRPHRLLLLLLGLRGACP
ncbi:hypothetical protein ACFC26_28170 [Kitasatospora purpeofusca]|uniref:hypothetical protein n=1 Tax=Kitasatospora purpeofusca TaxID=67352 RepID=UPI0035E133A7